MAESQEPGQTPPPDIGEYRGHELLAISAVFVVLDTLFCAARLISRRIVKKIPLGLDDYLIVLSYICCLGMCILGFVFVYACQVGYHIDAALYRDPNVLVPWGKTVWGLNYIWLSSCALPKLSILALYRRIFTDKWTTRFTWLLIGLIIAHWLSMCVAALLQCIPIAASWDKRIGGRCFNVELYFKLGNLPIIITDIPILILPLPTLWKLNASIAKKLGLTFIFICGGLGVIASIIRFALFEEHNAFTDNTWASVDLVGWSIIEPSMYLMASCLLSMKPLMQEFGRAPSRMRHFMGRGSQEKAMPHSRPSIGLSTVPSSRARAAGFATLPDNGACDEDSDMRADSRTARYRRETISVRKDVWVTQNEQRYTPPPRNHQGCLSI